MSKLFMGLGALLIIAGILVFTNAQSMLDVTEKWTKDGSDFYLVDNRPAKAAASKNALILAGFGLGVILVGAVLRIGEKATPAKNQQ